MSNDIWGIKYDVKSLFFDRKKVTDALDAGTRKALARGGALIRTHQRRSIKYRKKRSTTSKPGKPPFTHRQGKQYGIKTILFSYDPRSESVVIGMVKLSGVRNPDTARVLEAGGSAKVQLVIAKGGKKRKSTRTRSDAEKRRIKRFYDSKAPTKKTKTISMQPRPSAGPALQATKKQLPALWRNVVKGENVFAS